eukprot:9386428-Pyramimonas_sp.AAC.1
MRSSRRQRGRAKGSVDFKRAPMNNFVCRGRWSRYPPRLTGRSKRGREAWPYPPWRRTRT